MAIRHPYRTTKKVIRVLRTGKVTPGTAQYLGRQVWRASKTDPGGNYSNPKRRR